uniref:Uncharacterized protein n=1 Tax=Oryza nivara TaxID=4536 RepID=A0A0E0J899_ORYNI
MEWVLAYCNKMDTPVDPVASITAARNLPLGRGKQPSSWCYAERETTIIMVVLPDVGVVLMLTVVASGHRGRANAGGRESRRGESIPRGMGGAVW